MEPHGTLPRSGDNMNGDDLSSFRMIDVGAKNETRRRAVAQGRIRMAPATLERVRNGSVPKGDVLALAEVAGIMAAKRTAEILPLCHPLGLDSVRVKCSIDETENAVLVLCEASTTAKTGVEMEALIGANAALLSIYDLVKGIDPVLTILDVLLRTKEGGKSGNWVNPMIAGEKPAAPIREERVLEGIRAAIITVSDRCSRQEAEDRSGPRIEEILSSRGAQKVRRELLADDRERIAEKIRFLAYEERFDLIVLTGGTGLAPRDVTPEALEGLWTKRIPGVGELLRSSGARQTPMSWLSRSEGGLVGNSLVILLPGSAKAVAEGMEALKELIPHAIHIARGGAH